MADYYKILGVSRDASEKEIKQAFRRSARQLHPDINPGDKQAEARFKRINEAHAVLSDPDKRKKYDRYGDNWQKADRIESQRGRSDGGTFDFGFERGPFSSGVEHDPFGGLGDLLGGFGAGGRRRGRVATKRRIEGTLEVTLEQAFAGTRSHVTFGSRDRERRIEVSIPPGVDTGSVVHVSPDQDSDLYLTIEIAPHRRFQRKGDDLYVDINIPVEDAVLGADAEITTLKGRVKLKVPEGSQNGQRIRLTGQGMPKLGDPDRKGDLYVTLRPTLPKRPTSDERELFEKLRQLRSSVETAEDQP
ncbi:MAG: J domain-containing protein [Chloroflexi bacterium]|nr:J domain-containing protein [Chloroflexota bacterium]